MNAFERLKEARHAGRPTGAAYVAALFENRLDLCGDRRFGEDPAIISGIGTLSGRPVTYIAIDKGADLDSRMRNHFGCPMPEGYRKALRLMKQAEKFHRPVICLVDTLGAYCGAEAEERGQGEAIAENILEMMGLRTPVISVVIGEGGSGGALALAAADRVYMLENAVYSVISPEGCASILWKDSGRVADAAQCLHITAADMVDLHVAEGIIPENFADFQQMCAAMTVQLTMDLDELCALTPDELLEQLRVCHGEANGQPENVKGVQEYLENLGYNCTWETIYWGVPWATALENRKAEMESLIAATGEIIEASNSPKVEDFEAIPDGGISTPIVSKLTAVPGGSSGYELSLDAEEKNSGNSGGTLYYGGFRKEFTREWSAYNAMSLWVQGDGTKQLLTLTFTDGRKTQWHYDLEITGDTAQTYVIPFSDFKLPDYLEGESIAMDLSSGTGFQLTVSGEGEDAGSHSFNVDDIIVTTAS